MFKTVKWMRSKSVQNIYFIFKKQTSMRHITDHLLAKAWKNHIGIYTNVFMYAPPKQADVMEDIGRNRPCLKELIL